MSITEMRAKIMEDMDNYIIEVIGDDDVTDVWLRDGVPDGSTYEDLLDIAQYEACWLDIVNCFNECLKIAGVLESDEA